MLGADKDSPTVVDTREISIADCYLNTEIVEIAERDEVGVTVRKMVDFIERWHWPYILDGDV